jgi:alpha-beta hydrolase superfamily lysophospholipase
LKEDTFNFSSVDGKNIFTYRWLPDNENDIKAAVHIIHGMGEHAGRYVDFARFLTGHGFAVFAADQRGHGRTAESQADFGHYADSDGWALVLKDLNMLNSIIAGQYPQRPVFLFGHSAGAFLAQDILIAAPHNIKGAILSSTMASPGPIGQAGILVANMVISKKGPRAKSPFHKKLTFEKYNNYFKPVRTSADWISRDEKMVDAMLADPFCYSLFSATFYLELVRATYRVNDIGNLKKIPADMPIFIISGTKCALGVFGKGVRKVFAAYRKAGLKNVEMKLYEGARHELVNETNRAVVYEDIKNWILKSV